jgi:hypothetical protein
MHVDFPVASYIISPRQGAYQEGTANAVFLGNLRDPDAALVHNLRDSGYTRLPSFSPPIRTGTYHGGGPASYCGRVSSTGSLAMLAAMRRASSRVIRLAEVRRLTSKHVAFQMAEVAIPRQMLHEILRLIVELQPQPPPA